MPVSEQQRHQLFSWFEEAMGSERAATMMDLLPPVGWADVATKPDLVLLRHDLVELERRLDLRFEAFESRLESVEHRLESRLDTALLASTRTFVTWLLASQAAVITTIGVVAGAFAFG